MKNIKKPLEAILQQNVSRKEFLQYTGIAALSVVGITSMLQRIQHLNSTPQTVNKPTQVTGYGASTYGR